MAPYWSVGVVSVVFILLLATPMQSGVSTVGGSAPLPNATVSGSWPSPLATSDTLFDGNFSIGGITADGIYSVSASSYGFAPASAIIAGKVAVNLPNVNLTLMRSAIIEGTVVDSLSRPVGGSVVEAFGGPNLVEALARDITSPDGKYVIDSSLTTGIYSVVAFPPEASAPVWARGTPEYSGFVAGEVRGVEVVQGSAVQVDVLLERSGAITGTVKGPGGVALANITVTTSSGNVYAEGTTGPSGTYTIPDGLPQGSYSVEAIGGPGFVSSVLGSIAVMPGLATANVNFLLSPSGTIRGTVIDRSGGPVGNAAVEAYSLSGNAALALTSGDGSFVLNTDLVGGNYTLTASIAFFEIGRVLGVSVVQGQDTVVNIMSGFTQCVLSGRVKATGGAVLGGALVNAVEVSTDQGSNFTLRFPLASARSDSSGNYSMSFFLTNQTAPQSVEVTGAVSGYAASSVLVSLVAGQALSRDVVLQPLPLSQGSVSGRVLGEASALVGQTRAYELTTSAGGRYLVARTNLHLSSIELVAGNRVNLTLRGIPGTTGTLMIQVPTSLIGGMLDAHVGGIPFNGVAGQNATHSWLELSIPGESPTVVLISEVQAPPVTTTTTSIPDTSAGVSTDTQQTDAAQGQSATSELLIVFGAVAGLTICALAVSRWRRRMVG